MTQFKECEIEGYPARTKENIINSNFTIAFATDFNTAGERLTKNICKNTATTYIPIQLNFEVEPFDIADKIYKIFGQYIYLYDGHKINIAGNGIYSLTYSQQELNSYIEDVLFYLQLALEKSNEKIALIRSGGQTGIDEAGIVAADRLGIPTLCLAPKGWMFRNKEGKDIKNEQLFKQRFKLK
jgi:hypothetical protein